MSADTPSPQPAHQPFDDTFERWVATTQPPMPEEAEDGATGDHGPGHAQWDGPPSWDTPPPWDSSPSSGRRVAEPLAEPVAVADAARFTDEDDEPARFPLDEPTEVGETQPYLPQFPPPSTGDRIALSPPMAIGAPLAEPITVPPPVPLGDIAYEDDDPTFDGEIAPAGEPAFEADTTYEDDTASDDEAAFEADLVTMDLTPPMGLPAAHVNTDDWAAADYSPDHTPGDPYAQPSFGPDTYTIPEPRSAEPRFPQLAETVAARADDQGSDHPEDPHHVADTSPWGLPTTPAVSGNPLFTPSASFPQRPDDAPEPHATDLHIRRHSVPPATQPTPAPEQHRAPEHDRAPEHHRAPEHPREVPEPPGGPPFTYRYEPEVLPGAPLVPPSPALPVSRSAGAPADEAPEPPAWQSAPPPQGPPPHGIDQTPPLPRQAPQTGDQAAPWASSWGQTAYPGPEFGPPEQTPPEPGYSTDPSGYGQQFTEGQVDPAPRAWNQPPRHSAPFVDDAEPIYPQLDAVRAMQITPGKRRR